MQPHTPAPPQAMVPEAEKAATAAPQQNSNKNIKPPVPTGGPEAMVEEEKQDKDELLNIPQISQEVFEEEELFPKVTREKGEKLKKFEQSLLQKRDSFTHEQKINLLVNGLKPKMFDPAFHKKKFRCPYYKCLQACTSEKALKHHIEKTHKALLEMCTVKNGTIEWTTQALDFVLMVAKLYPHFVASIIKTAKKTENPVN